MRGHRQIWLRNRHGRHCRDNKSGIWCKFDRGSSPLHSLRLVAQKFSGHIRVQLRIVYDPSSESANAKMVDKMHLPRKRTLSNPAVRSNNCKGIFLEIWLGRERRTTARTPSMNWRWTAAPREIPGPRTSTSTRRPRLRKTSST